MSSEYNTTRAENAIGGGYIAPMAARSLADFAMNEFGGEVSEVGGVQGLSFVSYLTAPKPNDRIYYIFPETGEIKYPIVRGWKGGSLIQVTRNKPLSWERVPGKRGSPDPTFSKGARRRLMRLFATIERPTEDMPLFVTLTYPGKSHLWQDFTPEDWKRHLDTFGKRVVRKWEKAGFIWRLEPQKRGAPHFHLVLWGAWEGGVPKGKEQKAAWRELIQWTSKAWWEVVGSGDNDHLKAGTNCQVVGSWKHLMWYVSKYMAKVGDGWKYQAGAVGRLWGIVGRDNLPWAVVSEFVVTDGDAVRAIRAMRKKMGLGGKRFDSLGMFCDASKIYEQFSAWLC